LTNRLKAKGVLILPFSLFKWFVFLDYRAERGREGPCQSGWWHWQFSSQRGKKGSKTTRKEKEENALIRRVKERHPIFIIFLHYRQSIPNTSLKHIWISIFFSFSLLK